MGVGYKILMSWHSVRLWKLHGVLMDCGPIETLLSRFGNEILVGIFFDGASSMRISKLKYLGYSVPGKPLHETN